MMGRPDAEVTFQGQVKTMKEIREKTEVSTVTFQAKEALAVVNAASLAYAMGSCVLYDATYSVLLTQLACGLSVESLRGRVESFHPVLHNCMAHPGQIEVANNLRQILKNSKLAVHELDCELKDHDGILKQDRYALRSIPQCLAPVL